MAVVNISIDLQTGRRTATAPGFTALLSRSQIDPNWYTFADCNRRSPGTARVVTRPARHAGRPEAADGSGSLAGALARNTDAGRARPANCPHLMRRADGERAAPASKRSHRERPGFATVPCR